MTVYHRKMGIDVQTVQYGQPFAVGDETMISERDGVHLAVIDQGAILLNVKMTAEEAQELGKKLSIAAHKAHVHRLRSDGEKVTLASVLSFGRKRL